MTTTARRKGGGLSGSEPQTVPSGQSASALGAGLAEGHLWLRATSSEHPHERDADRDEGDPRQPSRRDWVLLEADPAEVVDQ
jgi:hypothetical protein